MGIPIFKYRYAKIPKLFSVIFSSKYRNSSQTNFGIIPKYRNSSQANFGIISNYRNSIKANFGLSEIDNACNQRLASAPTHIQINLCTVQYNKVYSYTIRVCIAAHSAQRVANRFCNNMSMTAFQAFLQSLRYSQWGAQVLASVENSQLHIIAKSIRCALWAAMHTLYSIVYSV